MGRDPECGTSLKADRHCDWLSRTGRALLAVEATLSHVSAAVLFSVMLIVTADVAMRYIFRQPFGWSYDLISLYLLSAILYLALPYGFSNRTHVSVDIVQQSLGTRGRHLSDLATSAVTAVLFAYVTYLGMRHTAADFASGAVTTSDIDLPTWIADALVPIGTGLLTLRLLLAVLGNCLALAGLATDGLLPADRGTDLGGAGH